MIIVIGTGAEAKETVRILQKHDYPTTVHTPIDLPSVTSLILSDPSINDVIILPGEIKNWSIGHLLAAAKLLQGKGHVIFLSPHNKPPRLIWSAAGHKELLELLKKSGVSGSDGSSTRKIIRNPSHRQHRQWRPTPLHVPAGKILILGVAGSQRRIGCTTHAIGLWHYCKKLGFDPAVVSSTDRIAEMAAPMKSEKIQDGYRIEGIPFVVNMAQSYDCYIIDAGADPILETAKNVDLLLLIAGIKPWELQYTMAAVNALKDHQSPVLLSYASEDDTQLLKPMFSGRRVSAAPWNPDLWSPSDKLLSKYEYLLYPMLEWIMENDWHHPSASEAGQEQNYELEIELKGD